MKTIVTPVRKSGLQSMTVWLIALAVVWALDFAVGDSANPRFNPYWFSIIIYSGINIILAVSLNLVNGFTGQFSIGHAGFMAVGAYGSALITTTIAAKYPDIQAGPLQTAIFIVSLVTGGILAAIAGYVVGMPSLRLRGDYLAIVTLGFGEIIRVLLLNTELVGGARGMPGIPFFSTFGWVFTFVVVTIFCVWRVVNSAHGRVLLAVREDEVAAEAMGVNTTQGKVRAFALGAFFAGIGGGLFAHYLRFLNTSIFDFNRSFEFVIMVVLGGMGSITGSVFAAILLTGMKEALRPLQELTQIDFRMIIYSLVLIGLMLTRPNGLFGTREIAEFLPKSLRKWLGVREAT